LLTQVRTVCSLWEQGVM